MPSLYQNHPRKMIAYDVGSLTYETSLHSCHQSTACDEVSKVSHTAWTLPDLGLHTVGLMMIWGLVC